MILEGWSANVHLKGASTDWADHTWVYSPENDRYFDCWGDHSGPNKQRIVVGNGSYPRADCYRCPVWPFPDTAGIGIFAIDGVCHQSTNCFLYTANTTLDVSVRGYWFSLFSYGTFGRSYRRWLANHYGRCSGTTLEDAACLLSPQQTDGMTPEPEEENPTIRIVREIYGPVTDRGRPKHPNELLADEVAAVTALHAPEIDPNQFRDVQMDYLGRKDDLIASGYTGAQLAERLDDLARTTQNVLAKRLGREQYERLMGVPSGVTLGLVNPDLAEAAGVATPQDVSRAHASRMDAAGAFHEPAGPLKASKSRWPTFAGGIKGYAGALG
jgi:hypothetical protein